MSPRRPHPGARRGRVSIVWVGCGFFVVLPRSWANTCGIYGTLALRGLRYSPLWLAAGWAFHPLWDVALHYFGPGGSFAPASYTITCVSFDLLVAAYVVLAYGLGSLAGREPALREAIR